MLANAPHGQERNAGHAQLVARSASRCTVLVTVGDAFVGVELVGEGGRATKSSVSNPGRRNEGRQNMHRTASLETRHARRRSSGNGHWVTHGVAGWDNSRSNSSASGPFALLRTQPMARCWWLANRDYCCCCSPRTLLSFESSATRTRR